MSEHPPEPECGCADGRCAKHSQVTTWAYPAWDVKNAAALIAGMLHSRGWRPWLGTTPAYADIAVAVLDHFVDHGVVTQVVSAVDIEELRRRTEDAEALADLADSAVQDVMRKLESLRDVHENLLARHRNDVLEIGRLRETLGEAP